ncbi:MAG: pentapeptide repeat-containing protein [Deltaproteobacteria bacterium]|nr:pentapeptide repeat-containing protein [Deltaproteobacteria bacterium]
MLTLGVYLAIALVSTTHVDLFLRNPLAMPVVRIEIALLSFFIITPFLFLMLHLNVMIAFRSLFEKVQNAFTLTTQTNQQYKNTALLSNLTDPLALTQILTRTDWSVHKIFPLLLSWITVVFGPLLLLCYFQLKFLPFHDTTITSWHRLLIILDLILLFSLWPKSKVCSRLKSTLIWLGVVGASIVVVLSSVFVLTVPGEYTEKVFHRILTYSFTKESYDRHKRYESNDVRSFFGNRKGISVIDLREGFPSYDDIFMQRYLATLLKVGPYDDYEDSFFDEMEKYWAPSWARFDQHYKEKGLWELCLSGIVDFYRNSRFIRIPIKNANLVEMALGSENSDKLFEKLDKLGNNISARGLEHKKYLKPRVSIDLSGRNFDGAHLHGVDLRTVRLVGSSLQNADLSYSLLSFADLTRTQLDGSNFTGTDLRAARFDFAKMSQTEFRGANFSGASFSFVEWMYSSAPEVVGRGAYLSSSNLHGTSLHNADLSLAMMQRVDLTGAGVSNANLTAADMLNATLVGSNLAGTNLFAVDLKGAKIYGVDFSGADLRGANFNAADIAISDFRHARMWWALPPQNWNYGAQLMTPGQFKFRETGVELQFAQISKIIEEFVTKLDKFSFYSVSQYMQIKEVREFFSDLNEQTVKKRQLGWNGVDEKDEGELASSFVEWVCSEAPIVFDTVMKRYGRLDNNIDSFLRTTAKIFLTKINSGNCKNFEFIRQFDPENSKFTVDRLQSIATGTLKVTP